MEATIFTGWIYDHLLGRAAQIKVAHPLMLRAVAAAKKKNDRIDAGKIADCVRCDFLPECHMASTETRDRRRTLRYRHLLVRQMTQMKNRVSGLLMENGVTYNMQRLKKVPGVYFVGLHFLYAMSSATLIGIGRDAERIVKAIASRVRSSANRREGGYGSVEVRELTDLAA